VDDAWAVELASCDHLGDHAAGVRGGAGHGADVVLEVVEVDELVDEGGGLAVQGACDLYALADGVSFPGAVLEVSVAEGDEHVVGGDFYALYVYGFLVEEVELLELGPCLAVAGPAHRLAYGCLDSLEAEVLDHVHEASGGVGLSLADGQGEGDLLWVAEVLYGGCLAVYEDGAGPEVAVDGVGPVPRYLVLERVAVAGGVSLGEAAAPDCHAVGVVELAGSYAAEDPVDAHVEADVGDHCYACLFGFLMLAEDGAEACGDVGVAYPRHDGGFHGCITEGSWEGRGHDVEALLHEVDGLMFVGGVELDHRGLVASDSFGVGFGLLCVHVCRHYLVYVGLGVKVLEEPVAHLPHAKNKDFHTGEDNP